VQETLTLVWHVVQNLALQEVIPLLQSQLPNFATGAVTLKNDTETIKQTFDITAAGDVDVVERRGAHQEAFHASTSYSDDS
jgi:hypothetical protein